MRTRREKELKPPRTELSKNIGKTQVILLKTGKKNPPKPKKTAEPGQDEVETQAGLDTDWGEASQ